jgi:hypothetical protein
MEEYSLAGYFQFKHGLCRNLLFLCIALECDVPILEAVFCPTIWQRNEFFFRVLLRAGLLQTAKENWERGINIELKFSQLVDCLPVYAVIGRDSFKIREIQEKSLTDKEKISMYFNWVMPAPSKLARDTSPVRSPKKT